MILAVKVVPGSAVNKLVGWLGDQLKIKVMAQAEKGQANAAVLKLLEQGLGVERACLSIHKGHSKPNKWVEIRYVGHDELLTALKKITGEDKIPAVYVHR